MTKLWAHPEAPWTEETAARADALCVQMQAIATRYPGAVIASSLQAEDAVLVDIAARHALAISIVTLDTLRLPEDTHAAIAALEARYGLRIELFRPIPEDVAAWESAHGRDGFYESLELRQSCCGLRKVAPLARALKGRPAWITGQRRAQAASRAELAIEELDAAHGIAKFNPLAAWSLEDVWAYVRRHDVPVHPLYARGYASIGCDPCTRAIRAGEEIRVGRWWWEDASGKECGLHLPAAYSAPAHT